MIELIVFLAAVFAMAAYMIIRNFAVYDYRKKLVDTIFSAEYWDYKWRLDVFNEVDYNDMMIKFWKPLDSFYPDKSFLDLNDVRGDPPRQQAHRSEYSEGVQ